jgi:hypothetical protein
MEEQRKSLKNMIEEHKKARQKQEAIENSTTKIDPNIINEQSSEVSSLVYSWDPNEYPQHTFVANKIEQMGFELKAINEETGYHIWTSGNWSVLIKPSLSIISVQFLQPSGNTFAACSPSFNESETDEVVRRIAKAYFLSEDVETLKEIAADKANWNKQHAKKLGIW